MLQTAGDLRAIQPSVEGVPQQLQEFMKRKAGLDDEMEELSATLDEISRHLRGGEHEEVSALEGKRVEHSERVQALAGEMGRYEERIENLRSQLEQARSEIDKAQVSEKRAKGIQQRFSLARKAADAIEQMFDVFARDMRTSIQTEAKNIFQRLIWKESQFEDIRLSEDYRLEVIDRWGLPARPELSAGERQVLSLAFITGMSKVTGEEAPLVMDTPFGRLSSAHREAITEHVADLADQVVMFVTDEELHSQARANLEPRIGAEYNLVFDQATGSTTINDDEQRVRHANWEAAEVDFGYTGYEAGKHPHRLQAPRAVYAAHRKQGCTFQDHEGPVYARRQRGLFAWSPCATFRPARDFPIASIHLARRHPGSEGDCYRRNRGH